MKSATKIIPSNKVLNPDSWKFGPAKLNYREIFMPHGKLVFKMKTARLLCYQLYSYIGELKYRSSILERVCANQARGFTKSHDVIE